MFSAFINRKPWAAGLLAFFDPFIGMLYLGQAAFAFLYFGIELLAFSFFYFQLPEGIYANTLQSLVVIVYLPIRLTGTLHAYILAGQRVPGPARHWYARWYVVALASIFVPLILLVIQA